MKSLLPAYVSSVDSGNLAGLLLTLRPGLLELPDHRILAPRFFDGLDDTLRILMEAAGEAAPAELAELEKNLAQCPRPTTLNAARQYLARLAGSASALVTRLSIDPGSQAQWWASALARQCQEALDDFMFLAPWAVPPPMKSQVAAFSALEGIPTLRELAGMEATLLPAIEHQSLSGGEFRGDWMARGASTFHREIKPARPGEDCSHREARDAFARALPYGV